MLAHPRNDDQPIGEYKILVVDVATGETTLVVEGTWGEWLDDHTLIIEDFGRGPGKETE